MRFILSLVLMLTACGGATIEPEPASCPYNPADYGAVPAVSCSRCDVYELDGVWATSTCSLHACQPEAPPYVQHGSCAEALAAAESECGC